MTSTPPTARPERASQVDASRRAQPSFWTASFRVFDLSLGQMLWSRRSVFLAIMVVGPVLLAVILHFVTGLAPGNVPRINGARIRGATIFGFMIWWLYIYVIVPVLGVFYGTSLIADEVDDKTITYLFVRPIPRAAVLVGKYLSYLVCTTLLILPSVMVVYFLIVPINGGQIGAQFPSLLADLGMLFGGLASYGAVFALVGARMKRPLVVGLIYAFGWEKGVQFFPGYLRRATVQYYLQGLVPHTMPQDSAVSLLLDFFREIPTVATSIVGLAVICGLALWLAGRAVERREYVLEQ